MSTDSRSTRFSTSWASCCWAGATQGDLKQALSSRAVAGLLASFTPKVGDVVFIRADEPA
ncbi:MAG TPA: hypothetical protein VMV69_11190 [Pirellulales bacterium]|nr:hypothetical protein [Pirellulales bacterium]